MIHYKDNFILVSRVVLLGKLHWIYLNYKNTSVFQTIYKCWFNSRKGHKKLDDLYYKMN